MNNNNNKVYEVLLDHQDWDKVIINKNKSKKDAENTHKQQNIISKNVKLEKKIEQGELFHNKVPLSLRNEIVKQRNLKKWTQKELANKINLSIQIINEIESGKAIYNHVHINKIKRILKIPKNI
ncbi:MAG: hypothetical protein CMG46_02060 [Candidatus Marinimicrobia bacterium]|nr:hypothetical protein [Candidatus Neomarinimicrobiota bacterium]|tara:strand:+ start:285 stop:656 length:372 start_codon:yes stop_codon:yes gene_type:complete